MSLTPLRIAAAKYVLDVVSNEDLRRVADEALTRGVYSYSLGELGTTTNPTYWVVRPLFQAAMKELGIALPSIQAVRVVTYVFPSTIDGRSGDAYRRGWRGEAGRRSLGQSRSA